MKHLFVSTLILFSLFSCNKKEQNDLYNKNVYIIGGDVNNPMLVKVLTEVQLHFKNNDSVYITKTASFSKKTLLANTLNKPMVYYFTYKNNILNIPGYNLNEVKITETPKSYNNQLGITLYKTSILALNLKDQYGRLKDVFGKNYQVVKELLKYNIIIDDISHKEINKSIISKPPNSTDSLNSEAILKCTNIIELQLAFGKMNIKSEPYTDGEGIEDGIIYTLFRNSNNEVRIRYVDDSCVAIFENTKSKWKLPHGLRVGMSLSDLVKLNSKPIKFYGFEWDYSGVIVGWDKGKLSDENLNITLSAKNDSENYMDFTGDEIFSSNAAGVNELGLYVSNISIKSK